MSYFFLRLTFSEIALVQAHPVLWTCVEFSSCSYWQKATKIAWSLPDDTYVTFYESDKCNAGGESHYISNRKDLVDVVTPKKGSFRSMMLSNYLHPQPAITHVNNCPAEDASLDDLPTGSSDSAASVGEDLAVGGGLSSNWNDSLAGF